MNIQELITVLQKKDPSKQVEYIIVSLPSSELIAVNVKECVVAMSKFLQTIKNTRRL